MMTGLDEDNVARKKRRKNIDVQVEAQKVLSLVDHIQLQIEDLKEAVTIIVDDIVDEKGSDKTPEIPLDGRTQ